MLPFFLIGLSQIKLIDNQKFLTNIDMYGHEFVSKNLVFLMLEE